MARVTSKDPFQVHVRDMEIQSSPLISILRQKSTSFSKHTPFMLVVPDISVYDPAMSNSLNPVGSLIEADSTFIHIHPIPRSIEAPSRR